MKTAVILNDTSYESHHGCETVVKNIIDLLNKDGIKTIDTNPVGVDWFENKSFLENMSKANIVIVNGEGTLHHAQPRAKELVTIGEYVKNKLNIPVVLINSTYQDNGDEIAEFMQYFDLIFVRETLSLKDLEKFTIKSEVVPDMTFYSKYDLSDKKHCDIVGITDSVYIELSEKLYTNSLKNAYSYLPALTNPKFRTNSIKNILRYVKYNIYKKIKNILQKIGYQFNHQTIRMFYYINGYENYIQQIADLKFLVVARYHSLCFSLKALTPFVAIKSNSHKIEGMLEDIGIGNNRLISEKELENIKIKEFSSEELIKIKTYIETAPLKIENIIKEIAELLD